MDPYFEQLIEYVLDILPEAELLQIKAHLDSGCKDCNDEVRKLQDTFHLLPGALLLGGLNPTVKTKPNDVISVLVIQDS